MELNDALKKIRTVKVQGAENIAIFSLKILRAELIKSKKEDVFERLKKIGKELVSLRPTEPCLRNSLNFLFYELHGGDIKQQIIEKIDFLLNYFEETRKLIADIGAKKIRSGMVVFTHCHSSTVMDILKKAKKQGKTFEVYNTETRPLYQGRITAEELSKLGIKVTHFVDSAARLAIKEADIILFGTDAITCELRVVNKIGSELFAEAAKNLDVPLYICTSSFKFDPLTVFGFDEEIEKRHVEEVWKKSPKNVKISNYAFEIIKPELITGIISEMGIYAPYIFVNEVKKSHPWMFTYKSE